MIKHKELLLVLLLFFYSHTSLATQDVESPDEVLAYMRMLMVVPEISKEIVRLGEQGCNWDAQVIWGGSPSEEDLVTGIFWKTLSMRFKNESEEEMWIQFAFSSKGQELIEVNNVTDQDKIIDCTV